MLRVPTGGATLDDVFGRDAELASIARFLGDLAVGPRALLVSGEAGIGKTTLWRAALEALVDNKYRLLLTRAAQAEAKLSFTVLGDLLDRYLDDILPVLPDPQRRALEVALLRSEARRSPPDQRTVSVAALGAFRHLAGAGPTVIAVDDAHWVDRPSARVLAFAIRRLQVEPVGVLATVRERTGPDVMGLRAGMGDRVQHITLGPLSLGALDRMLRTRLGRGFARPVLLKLHTTSGGNPFYALEIARALVDRDTPPEPGAPLPIPADLGDLLRVRLEALPATTRRALLAASALPQPTVALVQAAARTPAGTGLAEARNAGIIDIEGDGIRFTHPLLASVSYLEATGEQRRHMHRRLAEVVTDPEEGARHLALAATGPDPGVAAALDSAASTAYVRGAPEAAAELLELARRLTPREGVRDLRRRSIDAAERHFEAGDSARAARLMEDVAASVPSGPIRADALARLARIRRVSTGMEEARVLLEEALHHAGEDISLRAHIERDLTSTLMRAYDFSQPSWSHAQASLRLAERSQDPGLLASALTSFATMKLLRGGGVATEVIERALALEEGEERLPAQLRPRIGLGFVLAAADDFGRARAVLELEHLRAMEQGDEGALPSILLVLSLLECWAGNWERASRLGREGTEIASLTAQDFPRVDTLSTTALAAAHLGQVDFARTQGEEALALATRLKPTLGGPAQLFPISALGFLELSLGNPAGTHQYLGTVADMIPAMGLGDPGLVRCLPDEVEALVALGQPGKAEPLVAWLEERGRTLRRPWALATGARCRALLSAGRGDLDEAMAGLKEALAHHERLPVPFERGRTLLIQGQLQRRAKQWGDARASLQQALTIFNTTGAALWSNKAQEDLARVGGRPPAPLQLTATEKRVAELVAAGATNREVAQRLFMSVKTVEATLSRIYRKLGLRSRTELSARYTPGGRPSRQSGR